MVNTTLSTKAQLLTILRENGGHSVSGEWIASKLGLSRVAVWKAAAGLREAGYQISSDERGYALAIDEEDFVYPWEFGAFEDRIRHWETTTSTMDRARELAVKGTSNCAVVAEEQTSGRGRGGRSWKSSRGGLFCTLIRREPLPALRASRATMALQLAACQALGTILGTEVKPVWPNDLETGGKKIGGILCEFTACADRVEWINLGIGINVNNDTGLFRAISCREVAGKKFLRREILTALMREIDSPKAISASAEGLVGAWNAKAVGIGSRAAILPWDHGDKAEAGKQGAGTFRGIDDYGRALLETDGRIEILDQGSASLTFQ